MLDEIFGGNRLFSNVDYRSGSIKPVPTPSGKGSVDDIVSVKLNQVNGQMTEADIISFEDLDAMNGVVDIYLRRVDLHVSKIGGFLSDESALELLEIYLGKGDIRRFIDNPQDLNRIKGMLMAAYYRDFNGISRESLVFGDIVIPSPAAGSPANIALINRIRELNLKATSINEGEVYYRIFLEESADLDRFNANDFVIFRPGRADGYFSDWESVTMEVYLEMMYLQNFLQTSFVDDAMMISNREHWREYLEELRYIKENINEFNYKEFNSKSFIFPDSIDSDESIEELVDSLGNVLFPTLHVDPISGRLTYKELGGRKVQAGDPEYVNFVNSLIANGKTSMIYSKGSEFERQILDSIDEIYNFIDRIASDDAVDQFLFNIQKFIRALRYAFEKL